MCDFVPAAAVIFAHARRKTIEGIVSLCTYFYVYIYIYIFFFICICKFICSFLFIFMYIYIYIICIDIGSQFMLGFGLLSR